jgi:putative endonuclease
MSQTLGQRAESYALEFLKRQGLRLIARNFRCRYGEIDLILKDQNTLVFAEVRCRTPSRFGGAAESVDLRKQSRLVLAASVYLARYPSDLPVRFDVLALTPCAQEFTLEWIQDAFRADFYHP